MTRVKICGIKTLDQARAALDAGADFLGFIFYRPSHRYVEPSEVAHIVSCCRESHGDAARWQSVGVFVDEPLSEVNEILKRAQLDLVQLCGSENRAYCHGAARPVIRVVHVGFDGSVPRGSSADDLGVWRTMLDTKIDGMFGGTGRTYSWDAVGEQAAQSFLAGGLTPENVASAIEMARPWAVDVSGGVERERVKESGLIREFIQEVRRVDRHAPRARSG